jgi:hypothetical protein
LECGDLGVPGPFLPKDSVKGVIQILFVFSKPVPTDDVELERVTMKSECTIAGKKYTLTNKGDGPPAHELRDWQVNKKDADGVIVADAPGNFGLKSKDYPVSGVDTFSIEVSIASVTVARLEYTLTYSKDTTGVGVGKVAWSAFAAINPKTKGSITVVVK